MNDEKAFTSDEQFVKDYLQHTVLRGDGRHVVMNKDLRREYPSVMDQRPRHLLVQRSWLMKYRSWDSEHVQLNSG